MQEQLQHIYVRASTVDLNHSYSLCTMDVLVFSELFTVCSGALVSIVTTLHNTMHGLCPDDTIKKAMQVTSVMSCCMLSP